MTPLLISGNGCACPGIVQARRRTSRLVAGTKTLVLAGIVLFGNPILSAEPGAAVLDKNLEVRTVVDGLVTPATMAFLGPDDFLVLEKNTGKVQHIRNGEIHATVLDLAVNSASERGLLGIALHPDFPDDPGVYLFWTESLTGVDSTGLSEVPLLGNRVDRFVWDGSGLAFDHNLIRIRALQPPDPPYEVAERGNHNGGVLRFGPDGKLYIVVGDVGRRGWMQNVLEGMRADGRDDAFGGPEPTDAHLTGVVLRLNDDGTSPEDNPFFSVGAEVGGEVGENFQKVFAYGIRNSFGMDFDPFSGDLWVQENGDDSFTEINRVLPGMNTGWIQLMGPVERVAEYKRIETGEWPGFPNFHGLQQLRWPPELIADTPQEALAELVMFPGAHFGDPAFSWRFAVEPAGIGFLSSRALGPQYQGDLFVGAARDFLHEGHLLRMKLTGNRRKIAVDDRRLSDRVDDNFEKWTLEESEEMLFGTGFGIVTDVRTAPNGNLVVVSLSHGAVYEIFRRPPPGGGRGPGRR